MQYIIMLLIVIGLAAADILTGLIKAYVQDDYWSAKMRKGGVNKLGEIIVMGVAVGLNIGFEQLGKYYSSPELSELAGMITAFGVFVYITIMELISILENFTEINPQAAGFFKILRKLKNVDTDGDGKER